MWPEPEPRVGLEERDLRRLHATVRDGVTSCREALSAWFDTSESRPLEDAVSQAATKMLQVAGTLGAGVREPAAAVLVHLLLIAVIEEMGRPHVVSPN